jgi:hypothetical protein
VAEFGYSVDMPERLFVLEPLLLACGSEVEGTDFLLLPLSIHLVSQLLLMLQIV